MSIAISEEILQATGMNESQFLQEIALLLYTKEKLSLGKASKLARMGRMSFQSLLAEHHIPIIYSVSDFDADLDTLRQLGQL